MNKMKKLLVSVLILLCVCGAASADLLASFPSAEKGDVSVAFRVADFGKFVGDIFPTKFFAALNLLSADLGVQDAVKVGLVAEALQSSNLREAALFVTMNPGAQYHAGDVGGVATLVNADDFLKKTESGSFSLFDLLKAIGGQKLIDTLEGTGGEVYSLAKHVLTRESDGVFVHETDYVAFSGNTIISFESREMTRKVLERLKSNAAPEIKTTLNDANVVVVNVPKDVNTGETDLLVQLGISHSANAIKIDGMSNAFKVYPSIAQNFGAKMSGMPIVGNGAPFCAAGAETQLDGVEQIEKIMMMAGDNELTATWATLLHEAQKFGVAKEDIGNLLSGAVAFVLGTTEKMMGIDLPLGMYIALSGKGGAAAKIADSVFEALANSGLLEESNVSGWDSVYSLVNEAQIPSLLARKGEALLFGIISPENLAKPLVLDEMALPMDKLWGWVTFNPERIWNSARMIFMLFNTIINLGGSADSVGDKLLSDLFAEALPIKSAGVWIVSPENFRVDFSSNPASTPQFWTKLYQLIVHYASK